MVFVIFLMPFLIGQMFVCAVSVTRVRFCHGLICDNLRRLMKLPVSITACFLEEVRVLLILGSSTWKVTEVILFFAARLFAGCSFPTLMRTKVSHSHILYQVLFLKKVFWSSFKFIFFGLIKSYCLGTILICGWLCQHLYIICGSLKVLLIIFGHQLNSLALKNKLY